MFIPSNFSFSLKPPHTPTEANVQRLELDLILLLLPELKQRSRGGNNSVCFKMNKCVDDMDAMANGLGVMVISDYLEGGAQPHCYCPTTRLTLPLTLHYSKRGNPLSLFLEQSLRSW